MNNNSTTEKAIRGVFSATSYIDVGDKDAALPYPVKPPVRDAYTGKQMTTVPTATGKHPTSYLEAQHKWVMDGVPYVDKQRYADSQPEKKKGFLSYDYKRRDEFSKDFATNQYRERLKGEMKATKAQMGAYGQLKAELEMELGVGAVPERPRVPLFDKVFDQESHPAIKNSMVSGRETSNPTQLSWNRNNGATGSFLASGQLGTGLRPGAESVIAGMQNSMTEFRRSAIMTGQAEHDEKKARQFRDHTHRTDNESHLSFEGGFLSAKPLMHSNFDARYQRASDADFKNYKDETELVIGKMVK